MKQFEPKDFIVARWLALAGAAGAAVAEAFAYFTANPYWNTVGFVAALLAIAAIVGLWRSVASHSTALAEAVQESGEQQRICNRCSANSKSTATWSAN